MAEGEKRRAGRPKIEINFDLLEKLCMIQCTDSEIAAVLGISRDTVDTRKNNDPKFSYIYKTATEKGKMSLRRKMYEMANSGNVTMCIWLSKQYLDMKDRNDITGGMSHKLYDGQSTDDLEKEVTRLENIIHKPASTE